MQKPNAICVREIELVKRLRRDNGIQIRRRKRWEGFDLSGVLFKATCPLIIASIIRGNNDSINLAPCQDYQGGMNDDGGPHKRRPQMGIVQPQFWRAPSRVLTR